jgi:hypothetical protein
MRRATRVTLVTVAALVTLAALVATVGLAGCENGGNTPITEPGTVATPRATPSPGAYTGTQTVNLSSATSGAKIYYTIDGSEPTAESALYSGPLSVITGTTLKAIAVAKGLTDSAVLTASYTPMLTVATPRASPPAGVYAETQTVTLTSATTRAEIYYTTDGSEPSGADNPYSGPISVSPGTILKAIAVKSGMIESAVLTVEYTAPNTVVTPRANPPAGAYAGAQTVNLTSDTDGADI